MKEIEYGPVRLTTNKENIERRSKLTAHEPSAQKSSAKKRKSTYDNSTEKLKNITPVNFVKTTKSRGNSPLKNVPFDVLDDEMRYTFVIKKQNIYVTYC